MEHLKPTFQYSNTPTTHSHRFMLSRVANSIYWMSRYTERAENVARFIDVNLQMILDLPSGSTEQWAPLVIITGDDAAFAEHFNGPAGKM